MRLSSHPTLHFPYLLGNSVPELSFVNKGIPKSLEEAYVVLGLKVCATPPG